MKIIKYIIAILKGHRGGLLTASTTQRQTDGILQNRVTLTGLRAISWNPAYGSKEPFIHHIFHIPHFRSCPDQNEAYASFEASRQMIWPVEHCQNVSEDTYMVQIGELGRANVDLKTKYFQVRGTNWTTGCGWTNLSKWRS